MNTYLVRVQLNGTPNWQTYENLHARMAMIGCSREIRGDDGILYDLPHAEYIMRSPAMAQQVRDTIVQLLGEIDPDPHLTVAEVGTIAWRLSMSSDQRAAA